jgi:Asp/Glu/hydantoin racemase
MTNKTDSTAGPPKVALLSSTRMVLAAMEAAFQSEFPEAQVFNILDETLVADFVKAGGLSPHSRRKALQMALVAQEAGVDGILVTCSTMSPCVDDFKPFVTVPVVKIDEPVAEKVVRLAETIGLLTTAESVLKSVEPLFLAKAESLGRSITLERFVLSDLWPLAARDRAAFHRAVGEAATEAARRCQAVVITQVSMAGGWEYVEPSVKERVFATPGYAVRALRQILAERRG